MFALQCDEHIDYAIVRGLRLRGIVVFSCEEQGLKGLSDTALLSFCNSEGRILLTADRHFPQLRDTEHPGIIFITAHNATASNVIHAVTDLLTTTPESSFCNAIFYVP